MRTLILFKVPRKNWLFIRQKHISTQKVKIWNRYRGKYHSNERQLSLFATEHLPQMFAGRGTHMCICYIQHRLGRLLTLYQDLYSEVQTQNCGWRTYPLVQRSWWHHWGGLYAFLLWISYLEVITPATSWKQFSCLQSSGIKTIAKDHGYKQRLLRHNIPDVPEQPARAWHQSFSAGCLPAAGAYTGAIPTWQTSLLLWTHLHWQWSNKSIYCKGETRLAASNTTCVLEQSCAANPRRCRVMCEVKLAQKKKKKNKPSLAQSWSLKL